MPSHLTCAISGDRTRQRPIPYHRHGGNTPMADRKARVSVACPQCGQCREVSYQNVARARRLPCKGCAQTSHGETDTRLYGIWSKMKGRCLNSTDRSYFRYGGRGIKVCQEWAASYEAFRDWALSNGYSASLQIDRADNEGGYSPANCRWVTAAVNARNTRSSRLNAEKVSEIKRLCAAGAKHSGIARKFGVDQSTICDIVAGRTWADVDA